MFKQYTNDTKGEAWTMVQMGRIMNDSPPAKTAFECIDESLDTWTFDKAKVCISKNANPVDQKYVDTFATWITSGEAAKAGFNITVVGDVQMDLGAPAEEAVVPPPAQAAVPPPATSGNDFKEMLAQMKLERETEARQLQETTAASIKEALAEAARLAKQEAERSEAATARLFQERDDKAAALLKERDDKAAAEKSETLRLQKERDDKAATEKSETLRQQKERDELAAKQAELLKTTISDLQKQLSEASLKSEEKTTPTEEVKPEEKKSTDEVKPEEKKSTDEVKPEEKTKEVKPEEKKSTDEVKPEEKTKEVKPEENPIKEEAKPTAGPVVVAKQKKRARYDDLDPDSTSMTVLKGVRGFLSLCVGEDTIRSAEDFIVGDSGKRKRTRD